MHPKQTARVEHSAHNLGDVSEQLYTEMTVYDERVASKQNLILSGKAFDLARYSRTNRSSYLRQCVITNVWKSLLGMRKLISMCNLYMTVAMCDSCINWQYNKTKQTNNKAISLSLVKHKQRMFVINFSWC